MTDDWQCPTDYRNLRLGSLIGGMDTLMSRLLFRGTSFLELEAAAILNLKAAILDLKSEHCNWQIFQLENDSR